MWTMLRLNGLSRAHWPVFDVTKRPEAAGESVEYTRRLFLSAFSASSKTLSIGSTFTLPFTQILSF